MALDGHVVVAQVSCGKGSCLLLGGLALVLEARLELVAGVKAAGALIVLRVGPQAEPAKVVEALAALDMLASECLLGWLVALGALFGVGFQPPGRGEGNTWSALPLANNHTHNHVCGARTFW